jgi:arylsulfatase A
MKDAGYATCIVGKWQLNALAYKDEIPYWNDATRPNKFGFDEYCLWQLTKTRSEGERFADPLIEQNGEVLETTIEDYGPEIFTDYVLDFMERKKESPFFIYFPMVLVHEPFVPTPDSRAWDDRSRRYEKDTAYFKDMVAFTDKIVGRIITKLEELDLADNTLVLFTGDNGTHPTIFSNTSNGMIRGAKGNTIDHGVHVPLIAYWPDKIKNGFVFNELIEFSDFFPTFADVIGKKVETDGKSFYPLLTGEIYDPRNTIFVHYDPKWGQFVNQYRNRFVQTTDFKLYQAGNFYDLNKDVLEESPLDPDSLDDKTRKIKENLQLELDKHPPWNNVE